MKIYSINFDQCHATKNHYVDYSDRQERRSHLFPQTVNSFNRRLI